MEENITLEIVEERLKKIAKEHNLELLDEQVLAYYCEQYGGLYDEIADIVFPRYGFIEDRAIIEEMRKRFG